MQPILVIKANANKIRQLQELHFMPTDEFWIFSLSYAGRSLENYRLGTAQKCPVPNLVAVTIPDSMRQDGHSFAKERSYQVWRRHQYLQVRANDNSGRRRYHDLV